MNNQSNSQTVFKTPNGKSQVLGFYDAMLSNHKHCISETERYKGPVAVTEQQ